MHKKKKPTPIRSKFLTVDEVAAALHCTRSTIYRMLKTEKLEFAIKIGRDWRFDMEKIRELMERQEQI